MAVQVTDREMTDEILLALRRAVDARDTYTEAHATRVAVMASEIGTALGLSEEQVHDLFIGGAIHDVGKVGIPDSILNKPAPLDVTEAAHIRRHPQIGAEIVEPLRDSAGLVAVVRHHHERVDGNGYPDGLRGDEIPLPAKIVAVCDAFDAMISDRPYRRAKPIGEAARTLQEGSGTQWEPAVVDALLDLFVRSDAAPGPRTHASTSKEGPRQ